MTYWNVCKYSCTTFVYLQESAIMKYLIESIFNYSQDILQVNTHFKLKTLHFYSVFIHRGIYFWYLLWYLHSFTPSFEPLTSCSSSVRSLQFTEKWKDALNLLKVSAYFSSPLPLGSSQKKSIFHTFPTSRRRAMTALLCAALRRHVHSCTCRYISTWFEILLLLPQTKGKGRRRGRRAEQSLRLIAFCESESQQKILG